MILSAPFIKLFMRFGWIGIEPFNAAQLKPNSYDVTLDRCFFRVVWPALDGYHDTDKASLISQGKYNPKFKFFTRDDYVFLPEGETYLGATIERVRTAPFIVALMKGKSSTRRLGMSVCMDAGLGDIGYDNRWAVELSKHVYGQPYLEIGKPFAQIVFFLTTSAWGKWMYDGQYTSDEWPQCMVPRKYRDQGLGVGS